MRWMTAKQYEVSPARAIPELEISRRGMCLRLEFRGLAGYSGGEQLRSEL